MDKPEIHVYLAGPDVFFPDAIGIGERKKAFLASLGMIGHYPFDNEIPSEAFADPQRAAALIADANEEMMLNCCLKGDPGIILLNMEPFQSPFMDRGTAFEAGFMAALARVAGNVLLVGHTPDLRSYEDRVVQDLYGGRCERNAGRLWGPDGFAIEAFGERENLMVVTAIRPTGGDILSSFEEAALYARRTVDSPLFRQGRQRRDNILGARCPAP